MKSVVIFVMLLSTYPLFGQTSVLNDTLRWNKNKVLTWNDFKGEAVEDIGMMGEIFCMNQATFERPSLYQKIRFKVTAIFDRTKAWIIEDSKSDQALTYFQVMFNIYEVHARSLRKELASTRFGTDPTPLFQEKYNNSMTNLSNELNLFRRETKLGRDSESLTRWNLKVSGELTELIEFEKN